MSTRTRPDPRPEAQFQPDPDPRIFSRPGSDPDPFPSYSVRVGFLDHITFPGFPGKIVMYIAGIWLTFVNGKSAERAISRGRNLTRSQRRRFG